jgi:outer membrane protein assembly factor BamE
MPKITRRSLRTLLLLLTVALATSGCGIFYKQPIYQGNLIDKNAVEQLQAGMSKQDVISLLGTPAISDSFNENRWDYTATQRVDRRGTTEVKNFTVHFENARRQFGPNLAKDDKKKRR